MFKRTLERMRRLVRAGEYVLTLHGHEALEDDGLSVFDLEECFATGKIVERQRDRRTGEWKYLVRGRAVDYGELIAVAKIGPTRRVIVMTVFALNGGRDERNGV